MKQLISFLAIAILMVACGEKKSKHELHYTAIEKINVEASAFDAAILSNEWDANTGKGVKVRFFCAPRQNGIQNYIFGSSIAYVYLI